MKRPTAKPNSTSNTSTLHSPVDDAVAFKVTRVLDESNVFLWLGDETKDQVAWIKVLQWCEKSLLLRLFIFCHAFENNQISSRIRVRKKRRTHPHPHTDTGTRTQYTYTCTPFMLNESWTVNGAFFIYFISRWFYDRLYVTIKLSNIMESGTLNWFQNSSNNLKWVAFLLLSAFSPAVVFARTHAHTHVSTKSTSKNILRLKHQKLLLAIR